MKHITINSDRSVTVPVELRKIGVQYDHNVNTIEFVGPRYSGNVDLSTMTIYINYILSDKTPGKYKAENVIIDDQDDSLIRFNWTITRNVTKVSGILSCLICAKKTDEEGNEINHWNTDIFRLLSVSEGMENDPVIQEQYPDVITSLIQNVEEHDTKLLEFSGLNIRVNDLENNIDELKGDLSELYVLETKKFINGSYVNLNGTVEKFDGWHHIKIEVNRLFDSYLYVVGPIRGSAGDNIPSYAFLGKDGTLIESKFDWFQDGYLIIPDDACFFIANRYTGTTETTSSIQVKTSMKNKITEVDEIIKTISIKENPFGLKEETTSFDFGGFASSIGFYSNNYWAISDVKYAKTEIIVTNTSNKYAAYAIMFSEYASKTNYVYLYESEIKTSIIIPKGYFYCIQVRYIIGNDKISITDNDVEALGEYIKIYSNNSPMRYKDEGIYSNNCGDFSNAIVGYMFAYVYNVKKDDIIVFETQADVTSCTIRSGDYVGITIKTERSSSGFFVADKDYEQITVLYGYKEGHTYTEDELKVTNVYFISKKRVIEDEKSIYIASNTASYAEKYKADYVCDGVNDEEEIRKALNNLKGGTIYLSSGEFNFDSFNSSNGCCGISDNGGSRRIAIKGYSCRGEAATIINVTNTALEQLGDNNGFVFGANSYYYLLTLDISDLRVYLADNQHKVTIIDCSKNAAGKIERVSLSAVPKNISNSNDTPMPVEGCNGIRSWCGDDSGEYNEINNCFCTGFYEAFQLGAEHTICRQCNARFNYYGYTFGNYDYYVGTFSHPITLINCDDEHSACLPKFVENGYYNEEGKRALQGVDMISFNMELARPTNFGGGLVIPAHEKTPSSFCGNINYLAYGQPNIDGGQQSSATAGNIVSVKFFDNESGKNFTVKNDTHKLGGTTEERLTYVPHYMQEYYDTDLNKKLIYDGTNWVDYNGNVIS